MNERISAARSNYKLSSRLIPGSMDYALIEPHSAAQSGEPLPVMLLLHGGDGGLGFAERMAPLIERAWRNEVLRPVCVAVPLTGRSLFMDFRDGTHNWEKLLTGPFLDRLSNKHGTSNRAKDRIICGISMGGMGAMRVALKYPGMFAGAAALCPGVEAALDFDEIELRDRFGRSDDFYQTIFGAPVDREYWRQNNPASIAIDSAEAIAKSGIKLYLECGNADSFLLHHGTEFLHRRLFDRDINHEYRLIDGAEHIGPSLDARFSYAFAFLDKALSGEDEPVTPEITDLREKVGRLKKAAGYRDQQEISS